MRRKFTQTISEAAESDFKSARTLTHTQLQKTNISNNPSEVNGKREEQTHDDGAQNTQTHTHTYTEKKADENAVKTRKAEVKHTK